MVEAGTNESTPEWDGEQVRETPTPSSTCLGIWRSLTRGNLREAEVLALTLPDAPAFAFQETAGRRREDVDTNIILVN